MEEKKEQETGVTVQETIKPEIKRAPKFSDLIKNEEEVYERDTFNWLLNQPPYQPWIKKHPFATKEITTPEGQKVKVPIDYLPIEKVEFLLTRIFQQWRFEVLSVGSLFQSVYVTGRLHYKDPLNGEWSYMDGVAAVDIQTVKGKPASAMEFIIPGAIQKGLPAAESYCLKDCAEKLGKIFGKDLNRADAIAFTMGYNTGEKTIAEILEDKVDTHAIPAEVVIVMQKAESKKSANEVYAEHPELHDIAEFKDLVKQRHAEIDLLILQKKAEEAKNGNQS